MGTYLASPYCFSSQRSELEPLKPHFSHQAKDRDPVRRPQREPGPLSCLWKREKPAGERSNLEHQWNKAGRGRGLQSEERLPSFHPLPPSSCSPPLTPLLSSPCPPPSSPCPPPSSPCPLHSKKTFHREIYFRGCSSSYKGLCILFFRISKCCSHL